MKPIKIENKSTINELIESAESKCSVRLISYEDIKSIIMGVEERLLSMGVAKTNQKGAKFLYENGYKMPASYNGRPESTQFAFERKSTGWVITNIYRGYCDHRRNVTFKNEGEFTKFYKF